MEQGSLLIFIMMLSVLIITEFQTKYRMEDGGSFVVDWKQTGTTTRRKGCLGVTQHLEASIHNEASRILWMYSRV